MATTAQVFANQQNSLKSTGPRTPEGKLIASRNGISHGLSSAGDPVLPHENRDEFQALLKRYRSDHNPTTEHEEFLITQMAGARWRVQRAERIQNMILIGVDLSAASGGDPEFDIAKNMAGKAGDPFARVERHCARLESMYLRYSRELRAAQKARTDTTAQQLAEKKYCKLVENLLGYGPKLNNFQSEANLAASPVPLGTAGRLNSDHKANNGAPPTCVTAPLAR